MDARAVSESGRAQPLHHRADGGFRNPPGSPLRSHSGWDMAKFLLGRLFSSDSNYPAPQNHALAPTAVRDQLAAAGTPSVTWLGHAAFLIRGGGKTLLTDPHLGRTAGPAGFGPKRLLPPALGVEQLPALDMVLISHNHYDHLDADTLAKLPGRDTLAVIVPLRLGEFFRQRGFANVIELDWHQSYEQGGLKITALPAVHFSGRGLNDRNMSLWVSYLIESADGRVWFSGDTAYGEVFAELGERYGPLDLAIVGIGAYEPRVIMKASHATPEEAVRIARDLKAKRALGMHWGTIRLTPEDPYEAAGRFKAAARAQGYGADNAWIMKIGETRNFESNVEMVK